MLRNAEDKETTETDGRKPSKQEVSPFFLQLLLFIVHHLKSHDIVEYVIFTLNGPCSFSSKHLLRFICPLSNVLIPLLLYHIFPPQQVPSAEVASVPEKTADSDETKATSEEKTGDETNRTKSPMTKAEPPAYPKESAFKQAELPSSHTSPKSEWCTIHALRNYSSAKAVLCMFNLLFLLSSADPCKEAEKSSEKGEAGSPLEKTEDKENKPGTQRVR